jgi:hypothetical protein
VDLAYVARAAFAAAYLGGQGVLVLTAGARPDHAFGFRMFPEASTLEVRLSRDLGGGRLVPVRDGAWQARDPSGKIVRFDWHDRVREPALGVFDRVIFASYGADAQLARLKAALDDVATHIDADTETRALVLDVAVRKNGRDPKLVHLVHAR